MHITYVEPVDYWHHWQSWWLAEILVFSVMGRTSHQLDLIKSSPHKDSNIDANIQSAREYTFFLNSRGQENMIQFVLRETDILL